jgi:hypothetical protein
LLLANLHAPASRPSPRQSPASPVVLLPARRRLIALLDKDKHGDELTTEVAAYDLGEFARFHNEGRR